MKRGIGLGVLLPEEPVIFPAPPPSLTHEVTLPEMVWKSQKKKKKKLAVRHQDVKLEGQQREKHVGQQVGLHLTSAACKEGKNVMFITRSINLD